MSPQSVTKAISNYAENMPPGTLLFPGDLVELGSPEAIHTAFSRLVSGKQLVRLAKGIYFKPVIDPELGQIYPSLEEMAKVIAEREKALIRPTGAYALNRLGLSTQVPTKVVFLTTGNPKRIRVGNSEILFQKTTPKRLAIEQENIFLAVQALIALKDQANDSKIVKQIVTILSKEDPNQIIQAAKLAPQLVARILYKIAAEIKRIQHD